MTRYIPFEKRLQKELAMLIKEPVKGMSMNSTPVKDNLKIWMINVVCPRNTIYAGEKFLLQIKFNSDYPFKAPAVKFVGTNIPVHPIVYSNGDICLLMLTEGWTPSLNVYAICLSIISMLCNCQKKEKPKDDIFYVKTCHKKLNKTN